MLRRSTLIFCTAIGACIAALLISFVKNAAGEQSQKATSRQDNQKVVQKVLLSPDVPIRFDNAEGSPLLIREANVQTLTRAQYTEFLGITSELGDSGNEYSKFPRVTLINTTNMRIVGFTLQLRNDQSKRNILSLLSKKGLEPHGEYTFDASELIPSDKFLLVTTSGSINKIDVPVPDEAGQPRLWVSGDAKDLQVKIEKVRFEDGSVWSIKGGMSFMPSQEPPPWQQVSATDDWPQVPRISGRELLSLAVKRVPAVLPRNAQRRGSKGAVSVEIVVDERGDVILARATSGDAGLHGAAVQAAQSWKFRQPTMFGAPTKVRGTLVFTFR